MSLCSINVSYYWISKTYSLYLQNEDYLAIELLGDLHEIYLNDSAIIK